MDILETGDHSHTVYSPKYDAHYHSMHGAVEESVHVFLSAGLYHLHRQKRDSVSVMEMGFGTGLNAILTYLQSKRLDISVTYTTIESDPLTASDVEALNYASLLSMDPEQCKIYADMHSCSWDEKVVLDTDFEFLKIRGQIENASLQGPYDLIYYDAFAPSAQPHLWVEDIHQKLYDKLTIGGILVTYCTQGAFRRTLEAIGYRTERLNGPGKKREMLRATKIK